MSCTHADVSRGRAPAQPSTALESQQRMLRVPARAASNCSYAAELADWLGEASRGVLDLARVSSILRPAVPMSLPSGSLHPLFASLALRPRICGWMPAHTNGNSQGSCTSSTFRTFEHCYENTTANPIPVGRQACVQYLIPCYFSPAKLTQQARLQEAEKGMTLRLYAFRSVSWSRSHRRGYGCGRVLDNTRIYRGTTAPVTVTARPRLV